MGYNLIFGDVLSTMISLFLSIIINYIYIKKVTKTNENYFVKILDVLYKNIILATILVSLQFIIPIDTNNYFKCIGLLSLYLMISLVLMKIKNKKRG